MITDEQKQKIVQEILKTPIIASSTYYSKPCLVSDSENNNYIISGQRYKGCADEDYPYGRAFTDGGNQAIVEVALTQVGNQGGQTLLGQRQFQSCKMTHKRS